MRVLGTVLLSLLLVSLSVVSSVSAQEPTLLLSSLSLSSASVTEGRTLQGTVTLNMAAPADGVAVSLAAEPAGAVFVPASVKIPAGATSATFPVSTTAPSAATIYGNYGVTKSDALSVVPRVSIDAVVDRVIERERVVVTQMQHLHPIAETYIQNLKSDKDSMVVPASDQYFLGRLDLSNGVEEQLFQKQTGLSLRALNPFPNVFSRKFLPIGFAQMVMLDRDFQKKNYDFKFVRQEFLGEVRCMVLDVQPKDNAGGRFVGRIWVEDRDYNIVRFNGTYSPHSRYSYYLHFDSWRLNLQAGLWLPSYVFIEESNFKSVGPLLPGLHFKAQTRLWSYDPEPLKHDQEFADIQIDAVQDQTDAAKEAGPVEAQRMWERTAEDNALDHLQKVGLLAPVGDVDKILQTVVNNLIITNNLEIIPDVRCRVLLTSPLESFTVGHTIVVSRGLLDVLPDEASLGDDSGSRIEPHRVGSPHRYQVRLQRPLLFPGQEHVPAHGFRTQSGRGSSGRRQSDAVAGELALQGQARQRRPVPEGIADPRTGTDQPDPATPGQPHGSWKEHSDGGASGHRSCTGNEAHRSDRGAASGRTSQAGSVEQSAGNDEDQACGSAVTTGEDAV